MSASDLFQRARSDKFISIKVVEFLVNGAMVLCVHSITLERTAYYQHLIIRYDEISCLHLLLYHTLPLSAGTILAFVC